MAVGSRTTFKKRQKEMARVEKQRDKAARRAQKKEGDRPSGPEVMQAPHPNVSVHQELQF